MAWRFHGHARVDPSKPQAFAICDRCGRLDNLVNLNWQYEFNAVQLYNKRILVCDPCLDIPQQQFLNPVLPPDPIPVKNPRPASYALESESPTESLQAQFTFAFPYSALTVLYLDLYDGDPSDGGASVLEDITGSATRTDFFGSFGSPSLGRSSNDEAITFTAVSDDSVNVAYVAAFDAATSGNLIGSARLLPPSTVVLYNGAAFPIGNLIIAAEDG